MFTWLRKAAGIFRRELTLRNPSGWVVPEAYGDYAPPGAPNVLALSAAWACTNLIAGTIASLPVMVYRADRAGARTVAYRHPLYRLLHDAPNFDQTSVDFFEFVSASIELWGNAYAEIFRDGMEVVSLSPIRPDIMMVERNHDTGDLIYRWSEDGESYEKTQASILHIRGFGGSPLGGLSTLSYGRHTFGLASTIERASASTFRNGLRPAGVMTFPQFLTDEQRKIVEGRLTEKFAGAMNSGKPMILEGGTKWESLSINPEDAQMLQSRGFSVEEICRFFGVPPHMVGHTTNATSWGTGLEQMSLGFQKFTLRRRLKRIEQALERSLLSPRDRAEGLSIEFVVEGLLRGDSAARAAFYASGLQNGWFCINEVRALENMPPVEGGDIPRNQMQNVPINEPRGAAPAPAELPPPAAGE